jgi:hypothetical protein
MQRIKDTKQEEIILPFPGTLVWNGDVLFSNITKVTLESQIFKVAFEGQYTTHFPVQIKNYLIFEGNMAKDFGFLKSNDKLDLFIADHKFFIFGIIDHVLSTSKRMVFLMTNNFEVIY